MRTRIILGSVLAAFAVGMLFADHFIGSCAPCLFVVTTVLAAVGAWELTRLLPEPVRPPAALCIAGSVGLVAAHWLPLLVHWPTRDGQVTALHGFVAFVLSSLLVEMGLYRGTGKSTGRAANAIWVVAYLGLLPGYLVELRLHQSDAVAGTQRLLLAVFVPKCCDIGAYFTGRLLGRHSFAPRLSPKKTWEGVGGGLAAAALTASAVQSYRPIIPGGWAGTIVFGIIVGLAGIFGDLAESMIKRDSGSKDASSALPEFGGVLDVVDSILFAAPVVYWWLG